ncbi:sulfatase [Niabella terrae]
MLRGQQRPNILWITIEDSSPDFLGCYGNRTAHTPHIDRLANAGVRFTNAFSTGTVCSPSRTTIITGVKTYCTGTGGHRSMMPLPKFIKGFPFYLQQAGYYTTNNAKTDYNILGSEAFTRECWDESSRKAGWWNRKSGQPFFAVFNFNASHQSQTMTNPYDRYTKAILNNLEPKEIIKEDAIAVPPFYRDSPAMRKELTRVYNALSLTDKQIGKLLERLDQEGLTDSTIIIFYGDHGEGIPRAKTNGISLGFRVPFVIWFPPMYQHLSPWSHGVVTEELIDFSDLAPTMISLAGGQIPAYMDGRSFMGIHRSQPPRYLHLSSDRSDNGIDLVRAVTDGRYFYARNFMPFMPELRYIRYMEIGRIKQLIRSDFEQGLLNKVQAQLLLPRPAAFLFDTKADHWELQNLTEVAEQSARVHAMQQALDQEILTKRDVMLVPEGSLNEMAATQSPYHFRESDLDYPIKDIYSVARLSGYQGPAILRQQLNFLKDANRLKRYWAVTGLRSQPLEALRPHLAKLKALFADSYPPVAVSAAAIVYELDRSSAAANCLQRYLLGPQDYWALMGVNFLLYSRYKEDFVAMVKKCREVEGRTYATKAACMDLLGSLGLVPNDINHPQ